MNTNQYTQKTLEALQAAQQLAVEYQHNALEPEHLLHALATQEQGLIPQLLQKLNVDAGSFSAAVAEKLSAMPRVSGSGRDPDKVYISQATDKVLSAAAREAKAMKDDYVSVEHVFLALLDEQTQNTSELFRAFSITKDKFLQQLTAVRGNQRVTNDNPEDTYNALQKYGQDLVDLARKQKLDRRIFNHNYVTAFEAPVDIHFVTGASHPLAGQTQITLEQLLEYPLILTEKNMSYRAALDDLLSQNGKETMPIMEVGDTQLIRNLLCQGLGISYLPEFVIAEDLAKGNLVSLPMTEIQPDIWRQLLYHRNKWISPELKCVIKYLQEE